MGSRAYTAGASPVGAGGPLRGARARLQRGRRMLRLPARASRGYGRRATPFRQLCCTLFWTKTKKKSPLAIAKERFGIDEADPTKARTEAKKKLVEAVEQLSDGGLWIERTNEDKGLESVSNKKLLHLLDVLEAVKDAHGSRDKLIDAILDAEARTKDATYRNRFEKMPTPRLWDHFQAAKRRAARA